jgi:hypothetical protein
MLYVASLQIAIDSNKLGYTITVRLASAGEVNCQDLIILSNSLCNVIYIKERYCLASFLQEQHSCTCLVDTAGNLQHLGL